MAILNKRERVVMRAIYAQVGAKGMGLVSVDGLWEEVPTKRYVKFFRRRTNIPLAKSGRIFVLDKAIAKDSINSIISSLANAEYFESTTATEKLNENNSGREVYVIELKERGKNFPREERDRKKAFAIKTATTIGFAVLSFVVTMVLKSIFSNP